jgi:hypothetical protein
MARKCECCGQRLNDDISDANFIKLMGRFYPEMPYIRGPFGGMSFGKSYWNSYTMLGVASVLFQRLKEHIDEIESKR